MWKKREYMEAKRFCLILLAVTAVLCVPVFCVEEVSQRYESALLTDQVLSGIDKLCVVVTQVDAEPNKDGLNREELETKIVDKLKNSGIRIIAAVGGDILNIPELRVSIDMLRLKDPQQYAYRVQTSLATKVSLSDERPFHIKADIWKVEPRMQAVSAKDMPAAVTAVVFEQVDAFIHAYLAANPPGTHVSDVNDVNVVSITGATKRPKRTEESRPAEYKFVASKNSDVFHKPDCGSARKIKPANLTSYSSRREALNAGKRPCKRCNP